MVRMAPMVDIVIRRWAEASFFVTAVDPVRLPLGLGRGMVYHGPVQYNSRQSPVQRT